jgi:thioredoxin-dependent peroxiredoxin
MPTFTLSDQDGASVESAALLGKGPLVVYFYPKDNTPGCTMEACAFRDQYDVFANAGAEVVGISSDRASSHQKFADRYRLPFVLLSDPKHAVRKAFGVGKTLGVLPGRVTFVVDASGIIRHTFSSQLQPLNHVSEALAIVRELAEP